MRQQKKLIRGYVKRGDTIESLRGSYLGYASTDFWASIGGNINGKVIGQDWILVQELDGVEIQDLFSLEKIYQEIVMEDVQKTLF
jgi:hypothetical protein